MLMVSVSGRCLNRHVTHVRMSENKAKALQRLKQTAPNGELVSLWFWTRMRPTNNSASVHRAERTAHTHPVVNATRLQVWGQHLWSMSTSDLHTESPAPAWPSCVGSESTQSCFSSGRVSVSVVLSGRFWTRYPGTGVRWRHTGQPILQPWPSREWRVVRHCWQKVCEQTSSLGMCWSRSKEL